MMRDAAADYHDRDAAMHRRSRFPVEQRHSRGDLAAR
jgi:hypothetical protein